MAISVLLVEDEIDLAEIVAYNLQKNGYRPLIAHTGEKALEFLETEDIDLVLLDLMLPDMSGVDICKKIRGNEKWEHLPVIMVTAKDAEIDRVVGFEVGA